MAVDLFGNEIIKKESLRDKLNILGGNFASISFDKNWVIKNNHSL